VDCIRRSKPSAAALLLSDEGVVTVSTGNNAVERTTATEARFGGGGNDAGLDNAAHERDWRRWHLMPVILMRCYLDSAGQPLCIVHTRYEISTTPIQRILRIMFLFGPRKSD
jgi:hypothetical protein